MDRESATSRVPYWSVLVRQLLPDMQYIDTAKRAKTTKTSCIVHTRLASRLGEPGRWTFALLAKSSLLSHPEPGVCMPITTPAPPSSVPDGGGGGRG